MKALLFCLLFTSIALTVEIPISGNFVPLYEGGNDRPFTGVVTVDDLDSGYLYLSIGADNGGIGLTQTFSMPMNNNGADGFLDFAFLSNSIDLVNEEDVCGLYGCFPPRAGAIADVDAIGIYDGSYRGLEDLIDLRLTVYDQADNFNGSWEFDRNLVTAPEPSGLLLLLGLPMLRRRR